MAKSPKCEACLRPIEPHGRGHSACYRVLWFRSGLPTFDFRYHRLYVVSRKCGPSYRPVKRA